MYTAGDSQVIDIHRLYGLVMIHVHKPTNQLTVS